MEQQLPKVKPLCPPGRPPRYEDVPFAEVTLDNGELYTLKMDIYQDLNQKTPGPCIIYYFGGDGCMENTSRLLKKQYIAGNL